MRAFLLPLAAAVTLSAATPAAAVPPPPVAVPREDRRPPYEPPRVRHTRAARDAVSRSGFALIGELSLGDCTGDTCRNHGTNVGLGVGLEALYRLESGFAFGIMYRAQGVASQAGGESIDPCRPASTVLREDGCSYAWQKSLVRYRTYGVLGRYYPLDPADVGFDPFVGASVGFGWFQLRGEIDVEHGDSDVVAIETLSYELNGPALGLDAGVDLDLAPGVAVGLLVRLTLFSWDKACLGGAVGADARDAIGFEGQCGEPGEFDATSLTDAGTPTALQFAVHGVFTP